MTHRTKVMATLTYGQCADAQLLASLCSAGMKGVRINSAHVTPQQLEAMVHSLRLHAPGVAILMDTKGPELRTTVHEHNADIPLSLNQSVIIRDSDAPSSPACISIPGIRPALREGIELILDDGEIHLRLTASDRAIVTKPGLLGERKSVNLVGCEMPPLPAVSQRDSINLHAAAQLGIDMVAHSFVRSADDIIQVRAHLAEAPVRLLAKIETRLAVQHMDSILDACDGLLMARGDLGTQISPFAIPAVQRRCAELCRNASKSFIIATQILQSMMHSPEPTRAELSDIALGTWQGADYMLLCGETARGSFPVECVKVTADTICCSES